MIADAPRGPRGEDPDDRSDDEPTEDPSEPPGEPLVRASDLVAVSIGGILGAMARYGISVALPHDAPDAFPVGTLLINLTGCLLMGIVLGLVEVGVLRNRLARPFIAVGILGGYTTFSTFAEETHDLATNGAIPAAVGYVVISVAAGIAFAGIGVAAVVRLADSDWGRRR